MARKTGEAERQIRGIKHRLVEVLAELDAMDQPYAALNVCSAIEILNLEIGEVTPQAVIDELKMKILDELDENQSAKV